MSGGDAPNVERLTLGDRVELARLGVKIARLHVEDLGTALDRDGGTAHAEDLAAAKEFFQLGHSALEKALSASGAERAKRLEETLR